MIIAAVRNERDMEKAHMVEPLEQVIDYLKEEIRLRHIMRLQKVECAIEPGFVLSDILTNLERVSDHCSNIAGCVIEISKNGTPDMHKYTTALADSIEFQQKVVYYSQKYQLN